MVTVDQVICPVDLSEASATALRHAVAWARWYDAPLRVLHIAALPEVVVSGTGQAAVLPARPLDLVTEDVNQFVRDSLPDEPMPTVDVEAGRAVLLNALRERVPDDARQWCLVREDVLGGPTADALLSRANDVHAELIVVGRGDRRHVHALWLGSTTGRLLRSARCPVLIVPTPTHVIADPQDVRLTEAQDQHDLERFIVGRGGSTTLLGVDGSHV